MKYKKLLTFIFLCFIVYFIYNHYHDEKINYLAIGDSLSAGVNAYGDTNYGYSDYLASYFERNHLLKSYSKDFAVAGFRISDLEHQLKDNQIITKDTETLSLKKSLREADLVTLSIGGNDLLSEISLSTIDVETLNEQEITNIIDKVNNNLTTLLKEIRKYVYGDVVLIGYYNPLKIDELNINRIFSYLNKEIEETCKNYDVTYIELFHLFQKHKNYLPNPTNIHPSVEGYEAIAEQIIRKMKY